MKNIDDRIKDILEKMNIDAIYITNPYNMRYISGFSGEGSLFLMQEKKILFTDFRYTIQAKAETTGYEIANILKVYDVIKEQKCNKIGFEDTNMLYNDFCDLKEKIGTEIKYIPMKDEIDCLRKEKNDYELECISHAEKIGDIAFSKILDIIKPGITEREVAAYIEFYMKMNGASKTSFDTIVASGKNSAMPHAVVSDKKIEKGDFVTMDFGCVYNGYCSDMTRTVVVGKASDEQKKIYNTVLEAQLKSMEEIRAGVMGSSVDKIARDIIDNAGYKGKFGHSLGHGVGLEIHEKPVMSPRTDYILKSGNVVSVEPGIYIENFGGVRIEDIVQVTQNGCINFTNSDKKMIEL